MSTARPLLIAAAPNGAYKTRRDHRTLPVTAAQLADTAADIAQAGARMLHLHVRDARGRHTLAANAYRAAIAAIRARVDDGLFIQITSESAGVYTAAQQREAIAAACAVGAGDIDGVSIAPRELIREAADLVPAQALFHRLARRNVLAQYILYSHDEIARYLSLLEQGVIPRGKHSVLLVVGRRATEDAPHHWRDLLHQMHDALCATGEPTGWMVCAFGADEFDCLTETTRLGGHVRVGFENSIRLQSGETARDNRQLIAQRIESGNPDDRPLADLSEARKILGEAE